MTEAVNTNNKIEFARFINNHILQLIGSVDIKTTIIVAINGVLLGLLFQSEGLRDAAHANPVIGVIFPLVVGLLGTSAIFGLRTIYPSIKREPRSDIP
jgi:hypothetical protein